MSHWVRAARAIKMLDGSECRLEWSDEGRQSDGRYLTLFKVGDRTIRSFSDLAFDGRVKDDIATLTANGVDGGDLLAAVGGTAHKTDEERWIAKVCPLLQAQLRLQERAGGIDTRRIVLTPSFQGGRLAILVSNEDDDSRHDDDQ